MYKMQFQKSYQGSPGFTNTLPSKTLPDMSLSVKQLLDSHTRNIVPDVVERQEIFGEDIPRFNDITEMLDYKEELKAQMNDLNAQIRAERQEKASKDAGTQETPAEVGKQLRIDDEAEKSSKKDDKTPPKKEA